MAKWLVICLVLVSCNRSVTTTIDGSRSTNYNTSSWRIVKGTGNILNSTVIKTQVKFNSKGERIIELIVRDQAGNISKDSLIIKVN